MFLSALEAAWVMSVAVPDADPKRCLGDIAMTEPDAGSDLSGMRSTLLPDGDDYILKGSKVYISNGKWFKDKLGYLYLAWLVWALRRWRVAISRHRC